MKLKFVAMNSDRCEQLRTGGLDDNRQHAEQAVSDGNGNPCRHCLKEIPENSSMLILGYRPFESLQPYAETGPVFICGGYCQRYDQDDQLPGLYQSRTMLVRGYDQNERIIYGTGKMVFGAEIADYAEQLLVREELAFVHVRSSSDNCFHFRIERSS